MRLRAPRRSSKPSGVLLDVDRPGASVVSLRYLELPSKAADLMDTDAAALLEWPRLEFDRAAAA